MELKKIKCPHCSEETPVAESGQGFCLYCGAKLSVCSSESSDSIEKIERIYRGYIEWVVEYFKSTNSFARSMASFFTGSNEFKRHENHNRFIEEVQSAAQEINDSYETGGIPHDDIVKLLRFVLLEDHAHGISEAKWMYMAAEQFFEPLLPALTHEEAALLFADYKTIRKKDPGFPVQQRILKTLKKMR